MRFLTGFALGLLGLAASAAAEDEVAVELDRVGFPKFIESNSVVMVDYYAPWCGHCIKFSPKYEAAAKKLKEMQVDVKLAKVDCTRQVRLCQDHGIRAYPTMKIFKNNQELYHDYDGPRRVTAIVDFMSKQILPTVSELRGPQQHENFLAKERAEVVLIGYIDSNDQTSRDVLTSAAEKLHEDFPIAMTTDAGLAQAAGVSMPSLILYKPDNEGKVVFDKAWDVDAIKNFAKTGYQPLIGETGAETWRKYTSGSDGPTVFLFHKSDDDRKYLRSLLRPVAKDHVGIVQFTTAEVPDFEGFAKYLHVRTEPADDAFPALAIFDGAKKKKYPFDKSKSSLTVTNVDAFIKSFRAGTLEPTITSETVQAAYDGPVSVVTAKTYENIVLDSNKDVLLYFHREDCPYCNAMNPVYETLASMYSGPDRRDRITISKINILKNDLFEDLPYVPFIKLYKAGDKSNPVIYSGDRSVKDLVGFVKEQGTHKVDALQEHATSEDAVHGDAATGGEQKPMAMDHLHEQPLQGRTNLKPLHDEL